MRDESYFIEQAERCFRLARSITDREVTGRLEAMGTEFIDKAIKLRARFASVTVAAAKIRPKST